MCLKSLRELTWLWENPPFEAVFASKPCGFSNVMLVFRGVYSLGRNFVHCGQMDP